ncbi:hypothetical protein [Vitiosangium sp. GDMCC 1.1324]|uniref:hypothetical protein n=1 Tax=Vitiosangium sp. (strain GDMCC 1.1324) TaxID=2138576 RepID=UPI000D35928D|nr:hypothetical protein [Vitiosangium sp. GDMCC 1.1324]PTL80004.1 hypothetical protein DAT35_31825 [Vitiosangium sp. GDMCC 1.1324]
MKSSSRSPWSLSLVVLAIATLAVGCAASRREAYIQDKASQYVYRKPIAEVWPQVRMLLKEKDLPLRESPGGFEISTDWHPVGAPSSLGTNYVRYLVRGKQPTPAMCAVEIFRQNRTEAGQGPVDAQTGQRRELGTDTTNLQRDMEMEWELLQRVDPEGAKALRDEAQKTIK